MMWPRGVPVAEFALQGAASTEVNNEIQRRLRVLELTALTPSSTTSCSALGSSSGSARRRFAAVVRSAACIKEKRATCGRKTDPVSGQLSQGLQASLLLL